jgi:hypothetical protein
MSRSLAEFLPGAPGGGGIRVWLKSAAYTRRLLLGKEGDPWASAANYLAYFSQAHGLLRPDVAVVEVGDLYDSWLARHPELREAMVSKRRLSVALRKLLEPEGPRALLSEVIEAVLAHLRGQAPLVLAMPSPRHWLYHANVLAGQAPAELDTDAIEDAAMYVADLMRSVSQHPVAGLLLAERRDDPVAAADRFECYRPLINVVKHYRWGLALHTGAGGAGDIPAAEADALIGTAPDRSSGASGVDVSARLWSGDVVPELGPGQFYYVEIPETQQPEQVLESLAWLRM